MAFPIKSSQPRNLLTSRKMSLVVPVFFMASKVVCEVSKLVQKHWEIPKAQILYQDQQNSPRFARYVGNRLHILFHIGFLFHYKNELLEYCTDTGKSEYSRNSLIRQLQNPEIVAQLQALGLIG